MLPWSKAARQELKCPDKLCQDIVNGKLRQKEDDESKRESTGKMNKGQLSSMARSLCLVICRERVGAASGNCSSVVRSDGVNRPIGKVAVGLCGCCTR